MKEHLCGKCGSARVAPGHVTAVGFRFVPANAKLFYAQPVGVAAIACHDCGYLETYVSTKQLSSAVRDGGVKAEAPVEEPQPTEAPAEADSTEDVEGPAAD